MTRHDTLVRLRHMLAYAREAVEMVYGRQREDLDTDRMLNLALVRLVEIVGEAAARVPARDQARWSAIPWPDIIGLRNRLVHGYDEVNFDILWVILREDLPPLIAELASIIQEP
jgi:uncharacterized protein with HEPN domain